MNWTEEQLAGHYGQHGLAMPQAGGVKKDVMVVRPRKIKTIKLAAITGPIDVKLVLWGHCPSKKSNYRTTAGGKLITDSATKKQIEELTLQAMFQWAEVGGPVEHPEVTTTFYVAAKRQDEDGMYVTLMDVLQKAGVLVNDNIAHYNGRKIHEPCEFVDVADERVEITVRKS